MTTTRAIELFLVDDDDEYRDTIVRWFTRKGFNVSDAPHAEAALEQAQRRDFDVAVFDMMMPGMSGLDLLEQFKQQQPECEVIMLSGKGTIETAVLAMKRGAYDFLTKPFPLAELEKLIQKAHDRRSLRKENVQLKTLLARTELSSPMVGDSPAMREVFRLIERAGPSEKAILIQGESGTGKELVARALHRHSPRADKPLVVVNCAALPETLLESELFGHEKGAFTGAIGTKPGLFEIADGGTLFIDEIGELPGGLQAKLLRVLEDGSMRRIGSVKERRVNVRLLAATNRNLADEVARGHFREDLYYRINVMSLELPPLRNREGDIPRLVAHFLGDQWQIDAEAEQAVAKYSWPGNVRQLINALERAKIMAENGRIRVGDLPPEIRSQQRTPLVSEMQVGNHHAASLATSTDDLASIEREKVLEVLRREAGNKTRTARALGIDRRKIYRLIEKYNIHDNELIKQ
jgi:DNA-binding NtrC family response regulator